MLKKIITKGFRKLGYEIKRIPEKNYEIDLYYTLFDKADIQKRNFYNIGPGLFEHPVWTNIDYYSEWYKDNIVHINHDLLEMKPLPIESNSANIVYSSHVMEHIIDEAAQNVFDESFRILKEGGIIRITVPNIDIYYQAFISNDISLWRWEIENYSTPDEMKRVHIRKPMKDVSITQLFLHFFATQTSELHGDSATYTISDMEFEEKFRELGYEGMLNYCTSKCSVEIQRKYPGNAINWFNKDKLFRMLEIAGFRNIFLSGFGQSLSPVLRNTEFFDNTHPKGSVYVEAIK